MAQIYRAQQTVGAFDTSDAGSETDESESGQSSTEDDEMDFSIDEVCIVVCITGL